MENGLIDLQPPKGNDPIAPIGKIVGINLAILLGLTVIIGLASAGDSSHGLAFLIYSALQIAVQAVVNLLIALYFLLDKKGDLAKAFFLSFFVVLLVGFSACFGWASMQ